MRAFCLPHENEIRRCDELFVAMRIAYHSFFAQFGETALYQRAQSLVIE